MNAETSKELDAILILLMDAEIDFKESHSKITRDWIQNTEEGRAYASAVNNLGAGMSKLFHLIEEAKKEQGQ